MLIGPESSGPISSPWPPSSAPRNTTIIARSSSWTTRRPAPRCADLTIPAPGSDGWRVLEPHDLAGAEEALHRGGPAPAVEPVEAPAPIAGGAPSLADRVAAEADRFRRSGSPLAGFLADQLERLAQVIAFTGAQSPQDFVDRLDVHERDLLASEYDRGFADGRSRTAGYCPR